MAERMGRRGMSAAFRVWAGYAALQGLLAGCQRFGCGSTGRRNRLEIHARSNRLLFVRLNLLGSWISFDQLGRGPRKSHAPVGHSCAGLADFSIFSGRHVCSKQGECQRTIGAISAFSMAWKLPGVVILLQGGKLVRVGTPLRLQTNQRAQFTAYFRCSFLGLPGLAVKLTCHKVRALGIAKRALRKSTSYSNDSITCRSLSHPKSQAAAPPDFSFLVSIPSRFK
jgi:hypothetical protein